ncbi:hypothetical protein [Roseovarius pelagicus]|uniref:DUF3617 family protein n=1 Tax=Roseovarius pelagicus TaxID=2980108 RepID=A0ABY6DHF7_9RHOB|nr:hypothetical protein [Roseovarius pelagicus]UXX84403.1 hypothetical protein N7U68_07115 [Roseovarius pelagicus]
MRRFALTVILSGLAGTVVADEQTLTSRPDLCKADYAIQELEDVTMLDATTVGDHYIRCKWEPPLDLTKERPAEQKRIAVCMDGVGEWSVDVVFEQAPEGGIRLTTEDKRLPRKTYGPCPDGHNRPTGGSERAFKLKPQAGASAD